MDKITSVIAKENDGTVQITFTVPYGLIENSRSEALKELADTVEVPGFRKGKAPIEKVKEHVSQNSLLEKTLGKILPKALAEAITKHKIKPAIYPKFELISAPASNASNIADAGGQEEKDWQIKAVTCELPEIDLGDYKNLIEGAERANNLWSPDKSEKEQPHSTEAKRSEKEQLVIKTLLESIKFDIPKVLVQEEVDSRLANLLSRIEKLGLSLESYLASLGKTAEAIRQEYEKQSKDAISLEIILNKIAQVQNIQISPKEIEETIKITDSTIQNPDNKMNVKDKSRMVESILRRRAVLDSLTSLV